MSSLGGQPRLFSPLHLSSSLCSDVCCCSRLYSAPLTFVELIVFYLLLLLASPSTWPEAGRADVPILCSFHKDGTRYEWLTWGNYLVHLWWELAGGLSCLITRRKSVCSENSVIPARCRGSVDRFHCSVCLEGRIICKETRLEWMLMLNRLLLGQFPDWNLFTKDWRACCVCQNRIIFHLGCENVILSSFLNVFITFTFL